MKPVIGITGHKLYQYGSVGPPDGGTRKSDEQLEGVQLRHLRSLKAGQLKQEMDPNSVRSSCLESAILSPTFRGM